MKYYFSKSGSGFIFEGNIEDKYFVWQPRSVFKSFWKISSNDEEIFRLKINFSFKSPFIKWVSNIKGKMFTVGVFHFTNGIVAVWGNKFYEIYIHKFDKIYIFRNNNQIGSIIKENNTYLIQFNFEEERLVFFAIAIILKCDLETNDFISQIVFSEKKIFQNGWTPKLF